MTVKIKKQNPIDNATINVRITTRMANDEIHAILEDGTIKIRLTAPPVDGKANRALIKYLSSILQLPPSSLQILSGHISRDKRLLIHGLTQNAVEEKLKEVLGN